jgi:hypothetical protein
MYTQLGVVTKGTVIEVNVSELGLVTPGGKVVWGKYAQVRLHISIEIFVDVDEREGRSLNLCSH